MRISVVLTDSSFTFFGLLGALASTDFTLLLLTDELTELSTFDDTEDTDDETLLLRLLVTLLTDNELLLIGLLKLLLEFEPAPEPLLPPQAVRVTLMNKSSNRLILKEVLVGIFISINLRSIVYVITHKVNKRAISRAAWLPGGNIVWLPAAELITPVGDGLIDDVLIASG